VNRQLEYVESFIAAFGLVLLSPVLLLIGLVIKIDSKGPIFHRSVRVGKGGTLIHVYKFRTMIPNADRLGPGITINGDQRITRFGRWLRRTKLDEIPQLINVVKGEMSLVGPRPEDPRYVAKYTKGQRLVLDVRPGNTSPASLAFRDEDRQLSFQDWESKYLNYVMPVKLAIDLHYINNRTIWTDLLVIIRTIFSMFR